MAHHTEDDAFHEIQLNGKQLVFLFMAATVVSVVIFLCGVLVGRGVRAERGSVADASLSVAAETTPQQAPAPTPEGADPTTAPPPPPVDDLSYFNRLEKTTSPAEESKVPLTNERAPAPAAEKPAAAQTRVVPPPPAKEPVPASATPVAAAPAGQGYAVQIAALNVASEAEAIARRLTSKGYAAYVTSPATGTPQVYRVRVGKFGTRREAETVAAKLQKEEQFKPWVTR